MITPSNSNVYRYLWISIPDRFPPLQADGAAAKVMALRGFALRPDRWPRLARYEAVRQLDLQLPEMFGISLGAAVLCQEALTCPSSFASQELLRCTHQRRLITRVERRCAALAEVFERLRRHSFESVGWRPGEELVPTTFRFDLGEKPRADCLLLVVRELVCLFDCALEKLAHC
jgi:hypothetical protein